MARKKKKKIIVNLDLPKDDTTMVKLYAILAISLFIGFSSMTFWLTNSHFMTSPSRPVGFLRRPKPFPEDLPLPLDLPLPPKKLSRSSSDISRRKWYRPFPFPLPLPLPFLRTKRLILL